ncbi:MAG: 3-oxoacyl-[acyl-carrier-protein] reductase [Alphaproteobacteria bacterium]|nr:3-oxoacyl-[acyl-carrier-protein] reductase [Alphaproteobacteria bacterium]
MFKLTDQTALVTGASGSIGGAIAKALYSQGATVAISGTREDALKTLAEELKASGQKGQIHILPCNLSDSEAVEALFPKAEEIMGKVDILVNNAGITRDGLSLRMKDEDWAQVLDVNLTSSFRLCRAAIKFMMKRRMGRIINIASIVGVTGNAGQANYVASKAGLIGLSKSLAQEVASRGITVNCIAPGFITSPMTAELPDSVKEKHLSAIPQGRMGLPEEIAAGAVYLASPEAAYVTGQTLHINGGMFMN